MERKGLVYPDKPDLVIRNILNDEQCDFVRQLTEVFEEDKSPLVSLRRDKKGLYEVDRQYWTFREYPIWLIEVQKKLCKYYQTKVHRPRHWHVMKYRNPGDGLGWHAEGRISYVSFSINLSDPEEHEGGDFQVWDKETKKENPDIVIKKGDGIAYAGHTMHRVAPLISGIKYSVVAWFKDDSRMKEVYKKPFPYENEKKV